MSRENDIVNSNNSWRFISYALVTSPNTGGDDVISFWPANLLPFEEGQVNEITEDQTVVLLDINGVKRRARCDRQAKLEAQWKCTQDGRQTPPNVADGETVEIYQFGSEDKYYWVSNGRQPALRRLEHVTYAFSNIPSGRNPMDSSTSYGYTYSTREKYIRLWTSKNDGEQFQYQLAIDTKASTIRLEDDAGNVHGTNSKEDEVYMQNAKKSYLRIFGEYMFGFAYELICFRSRRIRMNTPSFIVGGAGNCGDANNQTWRDYTHVFANQDEVLASIGNRNPGFSKGSSAMARGATLLMAGAMKQARLNAAVNNTNIAKELGILLPDYDISLFGEGGNVPAGVHSYSDYDHGMQRHRATEYIHSEAPDISSDSKTLDEKTEKFTRSAETEDVIVEKTSKKKVKEKVEIETPMWELKGNMNVSGDTRLYHVYASHYSYNGNDLGGMVEGLVNERDQLKARLDDMEARIKALEDKA